MTARNIDSIEALLLRDSAPFALKAVEIDGAACRTYRYPPHTLADIFAKARAFESRIQLVHRGRHFSFGEIFSRAARLQASLLDTDCIPKGARIALAVKEGADWIASFVAVTGMGACAVLTPDRERLSSYCRQTDARFALATSSTNGRLAILRMRARGAAEEQLLRVRRGKPDAAPEIKIDPDREAVIALTSGSTGKPKAAILTQRNITAGLKNMLFAAALANARAGYRPHPSAQRSLIPATLLFAPLSHVGGYSQILLNMMMGGTIVLPTSIRPSYLLRTVERCKITSLSGISPDIIQALLDALPAQYDHSSVASVGINGIALQPRLADEIRAKLPGAMVSTGYGLTETSGAISAIAGDELAQRPQSSGRIVPAADFKIVDKDSRKLRPGQTGEVWLRGTMVMRGYCGQRPLSVTRGWFNTGDIGYVSPDRHLHVVDRRNGLVRIGRKIVSLLEAERIAAAQPDISDAAAIAGRRQTLVIALIAKSGRRPDCETVAETIASRLGVAFSAMRCVCAPAIPRLRNGKVDRLHLRESVSEVSSTKHTGLWAKDMLGQTLDDIRRKNRVPGMAAAVFESGHITSASAGIAALDMGSMMNDASRFEMSCLMKFFLSLVCLELRGRSTLDLSCPIGRFLPELSDKRDRKAQNIQIRHLLSHTSGYRGLDITDSSVRWGMTWERFADYFRGAMQSFEPGSVFNYEHSEHVILGEIIQRATGKTARELVQAMIFEPLGVTPGSNSEDRRTSGRFVANHAAPPGTAYAPIALPPFCPFWDASLPDWTITLRDVIRIAGALLARGRGSLFSNATLDTLRRPMVFLPSTPRMDNKDEIAPNSFGAGCAQYSNGVIGHNGSMLGQTCGLRIDPVRGIAAAVGVNAWSPFARDAMLKVLMARGTEPARRAPKAERKTVAKVPFASVIGGFSRNALVGEYAGSYLGSVTVSLKNRALQFDVGPAGPRRRSFRITPDSNGFCAVESASPVSAVFFRDGKTDTPNLQLGVHSYRKLKQPDRKPRR